MESLMLALSVEEMCFRQLSLEAAPIMSDHAAL